MILQTVLLVLLLLHTHMELQLTHQVLELVINQMNLSKRGLQLKLETIRVRLVGGRNKYENKHGQQKVTKGFGQNNGPHL